MSYIGIWYAGVGVLSLKKRLQLSGTRPAWLNVCIMDWSGLEYGSRYIPI